MSEKVQVTQLAKTTSPRAPKETKFPGGSKQAR